MDFSLLKLGFENYLKKKSVDNNQDSNSYDKEDNSTIFDNSEAFKQYIEENTSENPEEYNANIFSLIFSSIKDGQIQKNTLFKNDKNSQLIIDTMNELLKNEKFSSFIDRNENGEIDSEDILDFYHAIKNYDENSNDISLEDIASALEDINNGSFLFMDENKDYQIKKARKKNNFISQILDNNFFDFLTDKAKNGEYIGSSIINNTKNLSHHNSDLLFIEDIEQEKTEQDKKVKNLYSSINNIYSGKDREIEIAEKKLETAKKLYEEAIKQDEKLSAKLKKESQDNLNKIKTQQENINKTKIEENQKQQEIQELKAKIEAEKSELEALNKSLENFTNNPSSIDNSSKITSLQSQIKDLQDLIKSDEGRLNSLINELSSIQETLSRQNEVMENLNKEKTKINKEIKASSNKKTKKAQKEYEKAQKNLDEVKDKRLEETNKMLTIEAKLLETMQFNYNNKRSDNIKIQNGMNLNTIPQDVAMKLDNKLGNGFSNKVAQVAANINCNPVDLIGLMYSESGLNSDITNSIGAVGLIQFLPSTARNLGTTTYQLANMSPINQLDYVEKYFQKNIDCYGTKGEYLSAGKLYAYTFLPAYSNNEVLCERGDNYYGSNSALDLDNDGKVTQNDLTQRVHNKYYEFLEHF